jgi:predicted metalloprotease
MKWTRGYRSEQVDDRRNEVSPAGAGLSGGAISILFFLFRRFGIAGLLVGGAVLFFMTRAGSPSALTGERAAPAADQAEQPMVEFVSFVFDDAQNAWKQLFATRGARYRLARLELYRGQISSECGLGQAAMGPFYCPSDERVYIDLAFYDELKQRFGAPGDFAQAYVIAHEVGHHVQHILGTDRRVHQASEGERAGGTGLSVKLELQADCFAGIWARTTQQRQLLEAGDVDEALKAASVIGDDALQKQAGRGVRPESFTHGSSQQRVRWFKRGFESGEIAACDTFSASTL